MSYSWRPRRPHPGRRTRNFQAVGSRLAEVRVFPNATSNCIPGSPASSSCRRLWPTNSAGSAPAARVEKQQLSLGNQGSPDTPCPTGWRARGQGCWRAAGLAQRHFVIFMWLGCLFRFDSKIWTFRQVEDPSVHFGNCYAEPGRGPSLRV